MNETNIMENRYESIATVVIESNRDIKYSNRAGGWLNNSKTSFSYEKEQVDRVLPMEFIPNYTLNVPIEIDLASYQQVFQYYTSLLEKYKNQLEYTVFMRIEKGTKIFQNSKGSYIQSQVDLTSINFTAKSLESNKQFRKGFGGTKGIDSVMGLEMELESLVRSTIDSKLAVSPPSGFYTIIMDSEASGLFAHEVIGHNFEADIWLEYPKFQSKLVLGKKIASDQLTVIDNPLLPKAYGTYLYDDEGVLARETVMIKNGIMTSLLHSKETASSMQVQSTGNGRAISYRFKPIVRMSNTYIVPGEKEVNQLFEETDYGIYIKGTNNSVGGENFSLGCQEGFLIEKGKLTKRLSDFSIHGQIFQALENIVDVANDFNIYGGGDGGCGKMGQWPLPVSAGGSHIKVNNLYVMQRK